MPELKLFLLHTLGNFWSNQLYRGGQLNFLKIFIGYKSSKYNLCTLKLAFLNVTLGTNFKFDDLCVIRSMCKGLGSA